MTARFIAILLLACGAAALTALAFTGRFVPHEASFARLVQDAPGGGSIETVAGVLASPILEYALVGIVALRALSLRDYVLAAAAVLALAAIALNPVIKDLVGRDRPTAAEVIVREHAGGFGFPSGHVQTATLAYGYAAAGVARLVPRVAAVAATVALLAVAAIAFDRIYTGAHWPSDVAGGALIGLLLLMAAIRLPRRLCRRFAKRDARGTAARRHFG